MRERKELLFRSARTRKVVGAVLALFSKPRGADVEITCMTRNQYCKGERYTVRIDGQARQREGEGGREGGSYTRDLVTGIGGLARQLAGDHYVPPSQTRTEVRETSYAPHAQTGAGPAFVGGGDRQGD